MSHALAPSKENPPKLREEDNKSQPATNNKTSEPLNKERKDKKYSNEEKNDAKKLHGSTDKLSTEKDAANSKTNPSKERPEVNKNTNKELDTTTRKLPSSKETNGDRVKSDRRLPQEKERPKQKGATKPTTSGKPLENETDRHTKTERKFPKKQPNPKGNPTTTSSTREGERDSQTNKGGRILNCWVCNEEGHISRNCPRKKDEPRLPREDLKCFSCGNTGHFKRDCPLLKPRESRDNNQRPVTSTDKQTEVKKGGGDEKEPKNKLTSSFDKTRDQEGRYGGRGHGQREYYGGYGRGRGQGDYHAHPRREYVNPAPIYDRFDSMPSFVDTHCHLEYLMEKLRIRKYRELARRYCYPSNYDGCITSFCDPAGLSSLSLSDQLLNEPKVWASFGIHPHHASYLTDTIEDKLMSKLKEPKCVAFGEIGLDYSEHSLEQSDKQSQIKTIKRFLTLCPIFEKPLVLHCRDAEDDLLKIMKDVLQPDWKIHLHCFTGTLETALKFTESFPNLYLGVTGHVTYGKFRGTRDVVKTLPLNRILLETDAPYMVPTAIQERWSHPPMVAYVAEEIAKVRGEGIEEVLEVTRRNIKDIYGI